MGSPYFDYQFRVILIGDSTVGKSSLLQTFSEGKLTQTCDPTVGVDFSSRKIRLADDTIIKLQLWDTAGQEKFKNAVGALVIFDITNRESFNHIAGWYQDAANNMKCRSPSFILVGQKADLNITREVTIIEAECLAQRLGDFPYLETSAMSGANVEQAFFLLAEAIYHKMQSGIFTEIGATSDWDGIKAGNSSTNPSRNRTNLQIDTPMESTNQGCC